MMKIVIMFHPIMLIIGLGVHLSNLLKLRIHKRGFFFVTVLESRFFITPSIQENKKSSAHPRMCGNNFMMDRLKGT